MEVSVQLQAPGALPPMPSGWVSPKTGLNFFGEQKILFMIMS